MIAITAALTTGCAAAEPTCAPVASAPLVDARVLHAASEGSRPYRARVRIDENGEMRSIAVQHQDVARVPASVRVAVERRFPRSAVRAYEIEWHDGRGLLHNVQVQTDDRRECSVAVTHAGELFSTTCAITIAAAPSAITSAAGSFVPSGLIHSIEAIESGDRREYRVEVHRGGKAHSLVLREDGTLVAHRLRLSGEIEVPTPR